MDILVVLGVLVAIILILIGLYMIVQPKLASRKAPSQVEEANHPVSPQVEPFLVTDPEPEQITPVISANDFITQTIHQHALQQSQQQSRIHPTIDELPVHQDVESSELPASMKPELDLDLPLLVDSKPKDSTVEATALDEQDHNGLDAMLDDLTQATNIQELSRHGDIISDLNQVYDSLMPHTGTPAEALNSVIDTTQLAAWEGESALINEHLAEHTRSEEDSILVQAEQIIAIHLLPKSGRPLEGRTVLRLLRKYGLRFGEMDLFHRFEETSGDGAMMFSVLKYTQEGPAGFDLDTMEQENFDGLSFFLALPGIKPLQGFDMMMSTAQRLGQECYAQLLDDEMNLLSEQLKGHYRHQVLDFRPAR